MDALLSRGLVVEQVGPAHDLSSLALKVEVASYPAQKATGWPSWQGDPTDETHRQMRERVLTEMMALDARYPNETCPSATLW